MINYIRAQLLLNKAVDTRVDKLELFEFAQKIGMRITSKTTKKEIVERIFDGSSKKTFLLEFKDRFKVPAFTLAKLYKLTQAQINLLSDHKIILEKYTIQTFLNKRVDENFEARVFDIDALNYERKYLHDCVKILERNDLKIRIEVNDKSQIENVMEKLKKSFIGLTIPQIYENKKGTNYYIYTTATLADGGKKDD